MSRLLARIAGFFSSRTQVGVDKAGNRYFTRTEELDGRMKEKRWVVFKGEQDPTSVPVEWICWLNGQRKIAPTPEEIAELEARRERVKLNVALLKKEEKEKRAKEGTIPKRTSSGIVGGPDLKSFLRQFPSGSEGDKRQEPTGAKDGERTKETETEEAKPVPEFHTMAEVKRRDKKVELHSSCQVSCECDRNEALHGVQHARCLRV
ncbi:NADH dehydrogenase 1 alpha subcomplex subunit 12 [Citrus sinensis]|uniref:NADH dehydrogenase 1 alpha subcomplex subunit 12 n=1 Tax=Citrus sinensis TaxID=2711 RepID=A0ACB8P1G2_CITSI|nr:NADH dehydrogenase 1 alpha subcomplex subunit 12 [Citrus sinensis]